VKGQNELQAMNIDLSKHIALLDLHQLSIGMKDRICDQGLDMLLMYDQDVLNLLVFAVKETLALVEFASHSILEVLILF
jgi:hypothetical protein